jgi:hypothetical protein
MPTAKPEWDLLIVADETDQVNHEWFPAARWRTVLDFTALEGMRPRNVYLTSKAIEKGSGILFQILYRNAIITGGKVLHSSDFEGEF